MPPRPPRKGPSTRQFALIVGGLLLLLTIFQLARHRPQRFEPPPTGTSNEIGGDERLPADTVRTPDSRRAPYEAE